MVGKTPLSFIDRINPNKSIDVQQLFQSAYLAFGCAGFMGKCGVFREPVKLMDSFEYDRPLVGLPRETAASRGGMCMFSFVPRINAFQADIDERLIVISMLLQPPASFFG